MALTEEQKQAIEANRKRALERLKQRGIVKPGPGQPKASTQETVAYSVQANSKDSNKLTHELENTIEQNRLKAVERRQELCRQGEQQFSTKKAPTASPATTAPKPAVLPASGRYLKNYIEYDLSTMSNTNGGFISQEDQSLGWEGSRESREQQSLEEWQNEQRRRRELYENAPPPLDIALATRCTECKINMELDPLLKDVFHLEVCKSCVKSHPDKYSLLTKTECKEDYFLTDPELNDTQLFDRLEKPNPHSGTFSRMQLFLRCKVEEFAFKKWGGEEGLDKEWQRREVGKQQRRQKKYQQQVREMRLKTRAQEYTHRLQELKHGKKHKHEFGVLLESGKSDNGESIYKRRCMGCGIEIEEIIL